MTIGVVGRKCGMTQLLTETGQAIPVTVVEIQPNRITQVKTNEVDGYRAIQVTTGQCKASHVTKPLAGHYAKAGTEAGRGLWEFRIDGDVAYSVGDEITVGAFTEGQLVDVTGVSKGKGYAGTIKRYNFKCQPHSHGNSRSHRVSGSTGQNQSPRKVFKGKKMAGRMGNDKCTIQSQVLVRVDKERNLLLIEGGIPGATGADVIIRHAIKSKKENK